MSQAQWERSAAESIETKSVREIIQKGQSESRLLVRQIYREQIDNAVRSKIASMMRRRGRPWDSMVDDTSSTRDSVSS